MKAIILAAGRGSRLGYLTDKNTKCMVRVCDQTLISRSIKSIIEAGIKELIIVVGYKRKSLEDHIKKLFANVSIKFVFNKDFHKTNNIHSLFIASEFLFNDDFILLESDLIYDGVIVEKLIKDSRKNLVVVDKFKNWHDGTVVKLDNTQSIQSFIPRSEFKFEDLMQYYKTVNIYKFSKKFFKNVYYPFLKAYCESLGRSEYYEDVLRIIALIKNKELHALILKNEKWYEIDTPEDLNVAETIFAVPKLKYELLTKRYGGYWRFDELIDFCYLVNPFFPTKQLNDELQANLPKLIQSYPSGLETQIRLMSKIFNVESSYILVGNGSAELIKILSKEISTKKFGLFKPTFDEYTDVFENLKTEFPKNKNFRYGWQNIIELSLDTDGVILINPDNPSGNYIPPTDIIYILKEFKKTNKTLILDESFLDFAEGGVDSSMCNSSILKEFPNLVVIKSIGKSYGIGGLRMGALLSSNSELINKIRSEIPIWNINSVAEFYLQIIGKYKSEYIQSCKKIICVRERLKKSLNTISYIECFDSHANFLMCRLDGVNAEKLVVYLCEKFKILVKNCSNKIKTGEQYIRIAVRNAEDNQILIDALTIYLRDKTS